MAKANVIENGQRNGKKRNFFGQNHSQGYAKKFKEKCFVCNTVGHRANECRKWKSQNDHKKN